MSSYQTNWKKKEKLNDLLKIGHQFSPQRWHKTGFKSLAEHLKTVLLISSNQTAHLKSRLQVKEDV